MSGPDVKQPFGTSGGFVRVPEIGVFGDDDAVVHVGEGDDFGIAGAPGLGKVLDVDCLVAEGNQVRHEDARQLRVHDELHWCGTGVRPRT